jgi:hypothetical protein
MIPGAYFHVRKRSALLFRQAWWFELRDGVTDEVLMQSADHPTRAACIDKVHQVHKALRKQHGPTVRGA